MGVRPRRGVHVLVVVFGDAVLVRLAVERAMRDLGWVAAWSPADADVLAVCGTLSGDDAVTVDRLWHQVPGPRARVDLPGVEEVEQRLVSVLGLLDDTATQDRLALEADQAAPGSSAGGMDHDGMDMSGPAGIALAAGADDDRDGLEMDAWHVVLGAGLSGWPAGLVLRVTLHGDVVTALETLRASAAPSAAADPNVRAALLLDAAAAVLDLAGWASTAGPIRRARDDLLDGTPSARVTRKVERLARRIRRSALLRWSLQGSRRDGAGLAPGRLVRRRLLDLLDDALGLLHDPEHPAGPPEADPLAELANQATGQELAMLRLLVASLALDARVVAHA